MSVFLLIVLVVMGCSHLLAKGCDVSGGFDDALTAGLMLVQFVAEGLEDCQEWGQCWRFHLFVATRVLDACHC